jgi:hypothetical protein
MKAIFALFALALITTTVSFADEHKEEAKKETIEETETVSAASSS